MDNLIGILILIGIFSSLSSRKKKKARKQAAQARPAAPNPEKNSEQTKIPFTKEEWAAFLEDMENQETQTVPKPVKPAKPPVPVSHPDNDEPEGTVSTQGKPEPAAKSTKAPVPVPHPGHDEPEGTVSTQGESAAEHEQHRQKMLAEETRLREQQKTLEELRHMNRQKLRDAVVMSEVLGKPVSLRSKSYR